LERERARSWHEEQEREVLGMAWPVNGDVTVSCSGRLPGWYRNALKMHPGAILACRFCCCVLPLCQIALIPQPHPAMSAYVIN
ncbi:hypothetical protein AB2G02_26895, partial (plasmid) [Escherichia coli]